MKKGILFLFLWQFPLFAQTSSTLTFTEVMFTPLELNGEFIEVYNSSNTESVDISKYRIVYSTSKADNIIELNSGTILPPNSYGVIFENDYDFLNGIYLTLIPSEGMAFQIDNGKFGSYGMANTSDRTIYLLNEFGDTVDTYQYSANNNAGISDEKISIDGENTSDNWGNSVLENGTPGYRNSISPKFYDLEISSLGYEPTEIYAESNINITFTVYNKGINDATNFNVNLFVDYNQDSVAQSGEIIFEKAENLLSSGDSVVYNVEYIFNRNGLFELWGGITFADDENIENNYLSKNVLIRPKPNSFSDIVINEIMFKPLDDEPEWIELFNRSGSAINLHNWRFADRTSKPIICDTNYFIDDGKYLVLAEDETLSEYYEISSDVIVLNLPSLNNTGDDLKLIDSLGQTIDSVTYSSEWSSKDGNSLERIDVEVSGNDSTNWKSSNSKFFATPGKINSVTPKEIDLELTKLFTSNKYAVIGETFTVNAIIKNIGLSKVESYKIEFYDDANNNNLAEESELKKEVLQNSIIAGDSIIVKYTFIDFHEGNNNYIVKIILDSDNEFENNEENIGFVGVVLNESRNDIVINEIMHSPQSPMPEWIELFNRSSKIINLLNYQVADLNDTAKIVESKVLLYPDEYFVIADDTAFVEIFPEVENYVIGNIPNLNNSGDRIVLLDSLNRVIDSLNYVSLWGGTNGKSLERVEANKPSVDSTNWNSSSAVNGTPGFVNSVSQKNFDVEISNILFTPAKPMFGEKVEIFAKVKNLGKERAEFKLLLSEDVSLDSSTIADRELSKTVVLESADSILYQLNYFINSINSEHSFIIKSVDFNDQDTSNNSFERRVFPGYEFNTVVINEILYAPINGEAEWIELINTSDKPIDIKGFSVSDIYTTPKSSVVTDSSFFIAPNEFVVIAKDSLLYEFHQSVESPVIVREFANLNDDMDGVVLCDRWGNVIDSVEYKSSWGGRSGHSLERISVIESSLDSTNWATSLNLELSTPGKVNSVSQKEHDIEIAEILFTPEFPKYGDEVNISVKVINRGKENAEFKLLLLEDRFLDSTKIEEIDLSDILFVASGDSAIYGFSYLVKSITSERSFIVTSYNFVDEDSSNNYLQKSIAPGYEKSSIAINEIMYAPTDGEAEWVELLNTTNDSIDIKGFTISDLYTTPKSTTISDTSLIIPPHNYLLVVKDSLLFEYHKNLPSLIVVREFANLNNDIDGVIIKDRFGELIDSLEFKSSWGGNEGYSLERRLMDVVTTDSTNWSSSLDIEKSTPGKRNSITPFNFDLKITTIETIPLYPTIGEDIKLKLTIKNIGLNKAENYLLQTNYLIENEERFLESIEGNAIDVSDSIILITTKSITLTDSISVIANLNFNNDENNSNNYLETKVYPGAQRNSIIINEFMANPESGNAEWIELLNKSDRKIDISKWFVSDLLTVPKVAQISKSPIIIEKNEFVVLTNDTSAYKLQEDEKVLEVNFGILGNSDDGIILYDFNMSVVDSLRYDKHWNIEKGRSLERVSENDVATDVDNWLLSLSVTGSTPGMQNSILRTKPAERNSVVINEIMYDPATDNSEFVELLNISDSPIDIGGWQLIDGDENYYEISPTFLTLEPEQFHLIASDSLLFKNYNSLSAVTILESSLLSLANTGESLVIIDHWGDVIDSIFYSPKWHNKNIASTKNKSLERISPILEGNDLYNWSTSVSKYGATPGNRNSVLIVNNNSKTGLTFEPNPFSPDDDGFEDFSIINYSLPFNTSQIRIKIFDDKGRLVRTLANNEPSGGSGAIVFDGLNDNGEPLKIGMYIVFLEAVDNKDGKSISYKDVIVVARKL